MRKLGNDQTGFMIAGTGIALIAGPVLMYGPHWATNHYLSLGQSLAEAAIGGLVGFVVYRMTFGRKQ